MRYWTVVGLLTLAGVLWAQTPKSVIGFETPQHGWLVLPGTGGKLELTENPNDVKSGKRALRYTYTAAAGKLNAIIYLEPELWAQGFRFWIKADRPALFALSLQERDGERWSATFEAGGESKPEPKRLLWNQFTITDDTKGKGDGKLDPAKIKMLSLADWGALTEGGPTANRWLVQSVRLVK